MQYRASIFLESVSRNTFLLFSQMNNNMSTVFLVYKFSLQDLINTAPVFFWHFHLQKQVESLSGFIHLWVCFSGQLQAHLSTYPCNSGFCQNIFQNTFWLGPFPSANSGLFSSLKSVLFQHDLDYHFCSSYSCFFFRKSLVLRLVLCLLNNNNTFLFTSFVSFKNLFLFLSLLFSSICWRSY